MPKDLKRISVFFVLVITLSACVSIPATLFSSNNLSKQEINSCTVIDEPGRYELTSNITNGGGTRISQNCIEIRTGNVILDGNGHLIDGRGNSHTTAIRVNTSKKSNNIRIANVVITNWHKGIAFQHGEPGKIQNVTATSNVYGISVEGSQLVIAKNNVFKNNLVAMKVSDDSINIQLWGNTFDDNQASTI